MKKLSAILTLLLLTIMSVKSYSQSSDTVKYSYNDSGSRLSRIIVLGEGGGKGMQQTESQKKDPKEEEIKSENFTDQIGNNSVLIYPNPATSDITVEIKGLEENNGDIIYLYDQTGRLVQTHSEVTLSNNLNLSGLPAGIYFMVIKLKSGISKWSIIKH